MSKPLLKIYGERNTGTNYLGQLIALNLDVEQLRGVVPKRIKRMQRFLPGEETVRDLYFLLTFGRNLGWKHALVRTPDQLQRHRICSNNLSFVTTTKNPYSWLLSLYRNPFQRHWSVKPDFDTYLTSPWPTVGRENAPREFASPVEMWNQKNASYVRLGERLPALNLKYEDLLAGPERVIVETARRFSYRWKVGQFVNVTESASRGSGKEKDFAYYRAYYLEERWREKLSARSIALINERLDDRLLRHFGYQKLA